VYNKNISELTITDQKPTDLLIRMMQLVLVLLEIT